VELGGVTFIDEKVSPNGKITIYYQSDGPRLYRVNGVEVPSVTTVLDVLQKGGLPWWGMKVGVEGVQTLGRLGQLGFEGSVWNEAPADEIVSRLTANKLTVNHVRDAAGDRGTSVHRGLEQWASTGVPPCAPDFPESEQGYVVGLILFLADLDVEITRSEVMVGSVKHGYAGRYDLRAKLKPCSLCVDAKKGIYEEFDEGTYLLDLKTSKGVYATHFLQLEAYEEAGIEGGWPQTAGRLVVRVSQDGLYEVKRSHAEFRDFEAVLNVWKALEDLKAREKAAKLAAKEAAKDAA
jgi:hypothetical protein